MPIGAKWHSFKESTDLAPERPGAYELGDVKQIVVYIGKSDTSIKSRLSSHRKMKRFMKVRYFRFKCVEYTEDARKLEHILISAFKKQNNGKLPRLNKRTPPTRKTSFLWSL